MIPLNEASMDFNQIHFLLKVISEFFLVTYVAKPSTKSCVNISLSTHQLLID